MDRTFRVIYDEFDNSGDSTSQKQDFKADNIIIAKEKFESFMKGTNNLYVIRGIVEVAKQ